MLLAESGAVVEKRVDRTLPSVFPSISLLEGSFVTTTGPMIAPHNLQGFYQPEFHRFGSFFSPPPFAVYPLKRLRIFPSICWDWNDFSSLAKCRFVPPTAR
jgi:hypothetical protein